MLIATKLLSIACLDLNGLHYQVHDPLNYQQIIKQNFDRTEDNLDIALQLIRENTPKLIARVAEGPDFYVKTCKLSPLQSFILVTTERAIYRQLLLCIWPDCFRILA